MTHLSKKHILAVLYAGNYHDIWHNIQSGHRGTWYGHPYMVQIFTQLTEHHKVTILTCKSDSSSEEILPDGCRVIQAGLQNPEKQSQALLAKVAEQQPTHLLLRAPLPSLFKWATQQPDVHTMAILAQSYSINTWKDRLRYWQIARWLNHPKIEWVLNHNVNSSHTLKTIGVNPQKVIPWDWPQTWIGEPAKSYPQKTPWTIVYVGSLSVPKGLGDCIAAIASLKERKIDVQLHVAGKGKLAYFQSRVEELGISERVKFIGLIPNTEVVSLMNKADLVFIPSRHSYPEGFPFTINEALFSRTPIVASDHPTFRGTLIHEESAMVFPAGNSQAIADAVQTLMNNPALYEKLSHNSQQAWKNLQVPVRWPEFIERWLSDLPSDRHWLRDHALDSGLYEKRLANLEAR